MLHKASLIAVLLALSAIATNAYAEGENTHKTQYKKEAAGNAKIEKNHETGKIESKGKMIWEEKSPYTLKSSEKYDRQTNELSEYKQELTIEW